MRNRRLRALVIPAAVAAVISFSAAPAHAWVSADDSAGSGTLSEGSVTLQGVNNSGIGGTGECVAELYPADRLTEVEQLAELGNKRARLRADGLTELAEQLDADYVQQEQRLGRPLATGNTVDVGTDTPTTLLTRAADEDGYTGFVICSAQAAEDPSGADTEGTDEDYSAFAVPEPVTPRDRADERDETPVDLGSLIARWQTWLLGCLSSGSVDCELP